MALFQRLLRRLHARLHADRIADPLLHQAIDVNEESRPCDQSSSRWSSSASRRAHELLEQGSSLPIGSR